MTSFVQEVLRDTSHLCLHCTVRQLEQRVKTILDSIAVSDDRKRELIRGDAVDKAEQLSMFDSECVGCVVDTCIRIRLTMATYYYGNAIEQCSPQHT